MATKFTQDEATERARGEARFIISEATSISNQTAAGPVAMRKFVDFHDQMLGAQANLNEVQSDGGAALVQYIRDQLNDQVFDPAATFVAMNTELGNVITWMATNAPKDGNGNVADGSMNGVNPSTPFTLSTAQTAGFRTQLATLIAAAQAFIPNN